MSFPKQFQYYLSRLNNVRRNTVRLSPITSTSANPSDIIVVRLPSNSLVNLQTLNWVFEATTTSTGGHFTALPRDIESCIERMSVLINGLQVYSGSFQQYNVLWNVLLRATTGREYQRSRVLLQNSLDQTTPAANVASQMFCINDWLGFMNCEPAVIDTSVVGDIEIQIQLASTGVLSISNAENVPSYSLANMFFTVDVISFLDPLYDQMMSAKLGSGEVLEIPYQNVFVFQNTTNSSSRFALNSQCVNMLLAVNRASTYASPALISAAGTSAYFAFTNGGAGTEANSTLNYQMQVDNVYMPSVPIDTRDSKPLNYQYVVQSFNDHNNVLGFNNMLQSYANREGQALTLANARIAQAQFNHLMALNLNVSNGDARLLSGYNSAGSNAQFFLNLGAAPANHITTIFAICSSVLRVSAGRLLEVVV